jgi:hypothetical protein
MGPTDGGRNKGGVFRSTRTATLPNLPESTPMKRRALFLLLIVAAIATGLTGCTISDDPAPGGITATETGINAASVHEWQDRTIRELAY